jgi:hypothetical protein
MGFPPLHLGFEGEGVKQPMEIEGCGFAATLAHPHERGRKRPPSPRTPPGDDHTSSEDDEGDWLVSDSEEDDHENKGATPQFISFFLCVWICWTRLIMPFCLGENSGETHYVPLSMA